jgi:hypothetical protein
LEKNVIISLISVGVGWALAQGTSLTKDLLQSWKLKRGLLEELGDLREQLGRVDKSYRRQLQFYALNGIEPAAPIAIPNLFFKQYYKDVFNKLNREQRLSYQLIHGTIDSLNYKNTEFMKFTTDLAEKLKFSENQEEIERAVELWGDRVKALFCQVWDAFFYVDFHQRHKKRPILDFNGPMHKEYLQFAEKVQQEMNKVIEGARENLKREDLEKLYDEKFFPPDSKKNP